MNEEQNNASSNPFADEHLAVGGEIIEDDHHISADVLEDVNASETNETEETTTDS